MKIKLDSKTLIRLTKFFAPFILGFCVFSALGLTLEKEVWEHLWPLLTGYFFPPLGKESIIPTGVLVFGINPLIMALSVAFVDILVALFLVWNYDLAKKIPFVGKFIVKIETKGKNIVVCGDFNTAHKEIDLARPKENEHVSGFLPIERAWMDTFIDHGYVDTFRYFNKDVGQYSWWDLKTRARERNVGWRIDYFFVNKEFLPHVEKAFIEQDVMGSDHCPVGIEIRT